MLTFCLGCAISIEWNSFLCPDCYDKIGRLQTNKKRFVPAPRLVLDPRGHPVTSLCHYEGLIRLLALRAKVESETRALDFLSQYFATHARVAVACNWADVIVPMPSSLWGRLRGRLDLGFALARAASLRWQRPLIEGPSSLFWRAKKRALRGDKKWRPSDIQFHAKDLLRERLIQRKLGVLPEDRLPRIVIVDDIVTSGFTMATLAACFPNCSVRAVVLADAVGRVASINDEVNDDVAVSTANRAHDPDDASIL